MKHIQHVILVYFVTLVYLRRIKLNVRRRVKRQNLKINDRKLWTKPFLLKARTHDASSTVQRTIVLLKKSELFRIKDFSLFAVLQKCLFSSFFFRLSFSIKRFFEQSQEENMTEEIFQFKENEKLQNFEFLKDSWHQSQTVELWWCFLCNSFELFFKKKNQFPLCLLFWGLFIFSSAKISYVMGPNESMSNNFETLLKRKQTFVASFGIKKDR